MDEKKEAFERILNIMDDLRSQCPWDKVQTWESLRTLTIEEVYELVEAIQNNDKQEIKKELGDVLLHIVFYAKIASEEKAFDIAEVIHALSEKLIRRHPHIYGDTQVADAQEVSQNWEQIKLKEKGNQSVLGGVPSSLPALIKAYRLQDKARGVGFDWKEKEQVWDKVREELGELEVEMKAENTDKMEAELGDFLFSVINMARLYGINPENALERTNRKFIHRFKHLEEMTLKKGRSLHDMSLEEMDVYWNQAKKME